MAASRSSALNARYRNQTRLAQAFASETHLAAIALYALLGALLLTSLLALVLSTVWLVCALRATPPRRLSASASASASGCPTREQSTPERIIDESPTGPAPIPVPDLAADPRARHFIGAGYNIVCTASDPAFDGAPVDTVLVSTSALTSADSFHPHPLAAARFEASAQSAAAHRRSGSGSSSTQGSGNSTFVHAVLCCALLCFMCARRVLDETRREEKSACLQVSLQLHLRIRRAGNFISCPSHLNALRRALPPYCTAHRSRRPRRRPAVLCCALIIL